MYFFYLGLTIVQVIGIQSDIRSNPIYTKWSIVFIEIIPSLSVLNGEVSVFLNWFKFKYWCNFLYEFIKNLILTTKYKFGKLNYFNLGI